MTYEPLSGDGYTLDEARAAWRDSMNRSAPQWSLRGQPGAWSWRYFNFRDWTGHVVLKEDGFHWSTRTYETGDVIHEGVTTSLYEAYQSVIRNEPVTRKA